MSYKESTGFGLVLRYIRERTMVYKYRSSSTEGEDCCLVSLPSFFGEAVGLKGDIWRFGDKTFRAEFKKRLF